MTVTFLFKTYSFLPTFCAKRLERMLDLPFLEPKDRNTKGPVMTLQVPEGVNISFLHFFNFSIVFKHVQSVSVVNLHEGRCQYHTWNMQMQVYSLQNLLNSCFDQFVRWCRNVRSCQVTMTQTTHELTFWSVFCQRNHRESSKTSHSAQISWSSQNLSSGCNDLIHALKIAVPNHRFWGETHDHQATGQVKQCRYSFNMAESV